MNQSPAPWNPSALARATTDSAKMIANLLKLAKDIESDSRKEERCAAQKCIACFYRSIMAGQAITTRPCACCQVTQTYGSTNTNVLCLPCARTHQLCAHCGADVELNTRRTQWPSTS